MRRFRIGLVTQDDIKTIHTRFIGNSNITLPPITQLRCACYTNDERNAYSNVVFIQHLKATHEKTSDHTVVCPDHTCIIKATMKYKNKQAGAFNRNMYNRLLDECGDADIISSKKTFVDPVLKFFHNIPLMMNTNERIGEKLANGTPCRGLYLKLKPGCEFVKESWEGYMVNTISVDQAKHIVCMTESTDSKYFTVKPETGLCKIKLRQFNKTSLERQYINNWLKTLRVNIGLLIY